MNLGDAAELTRTFSASDLEEFTELSQHAAVENQVPEPLIGALFSFLLGTRLPGFGANYLKQETHFHRFALIGDALTARVEITRIRRDKHLVDLATTCTNPAGELVATGRALVSVRDVGA